MKLYDNGIEHVISLDTQVQCQLDKEGASSLVIDLVIKNSSNRVFLESVELGIALLEGGNTNIQVSIVYGWDRQLRIAASDLHTQLPQSFKHSFSIHVFLHFEPKISSFLRFFENLY